MNIIDKDFGLRLTEIRPSAKYPGKLRARVTFPYLAKPKTVIGQRLDAVRLFDDSLTGLGKTRVKSIYMNASLHNLQAICTDHNGEPLSSEDWNTLLGLSPSEWKDINPLKIKGLAMHWYQTTDPTALFKLIGEKADADVRYFGKISPKDSEGYYKVFCTTDMKPILQGGYVFIAETESPKINEVLIEPKENANEYTESFTSVEEARDFVVEFYEGAVAPQELAAGEEGEEEPAAKAPVKPARRTQIA